MQPRPLPVWRSLLFVPVTVDKFVENAASRGADALILDLEDSIPPADKERARQLVEQAAARVGSARADVVVRVNHPWRLLVRDLEASVCAGVNAIMLTKVESAEHVTAVAAILDELEEERGLQPGHTRLVTMVETAAGFFRIEQIARAHRRVVALGLGTEDLAFSLGMVPDSETLLYPKQQGVIAARAAGILPLGFLGTVADLRDVDAFRGLIRRSRKFGFVGANCIHPMQVKVLNEEYRPSMAEVEEARDLIATYAEAAAAGKGALRFRGKMIDVPVVQRAQELLDREALIVAREAH